MNSIWNSSREKQLASAKKLAHNDDKDKSNPFSPYSFASEEDTSMRTPAIKNAKEAGKITTSTRIKLFKAKSFTNVGFFSSSSKKISDLHSGNENNNNTININNNTNSNKLSNDENNNNNGHNNHSTNKPFKILKNVINKMPLDRYSSLTNFNFFSDSKIRYRKLTNPLTSNKYDSNNTLNSTTGPTSKFFTISEKDEEYIKEALVFILFKISLYFGFKGTIK